MPGTGSAACCSRTPTTRVVGAVGSADKADFLHECGADEVVAYGDPSWGDPVDLVLDAVGGDLVQRGVDDLAPFGRMVAFGAAGGLVDTGTLLGGLTSVIGFSIGLLHRTQPDLIEERRAELWGLLADGGLRPRHVDFPLDQVDEAINLIARRGNLGRVALRTDESQP